MPSLEVPVFGDNVSEFKSLPWSTAYLESQQWIVRVMPDILPNRHKRIVIVASEQSPAAQAYLQELFARTESYFANIAMAAVEELVGMAAMVQPSMDRRFAIRDIHEAMLVYDN